MISRRHFIGALLATGLPLEAIAKMESKTVPNEFLVSAAGNEKTGYQFGYVVTKTHQLEREMSQFRGHGLSQHPLHPTQVIMYARRPGNMAIVTDVLQQKVVNRFPVAKNRFFYGHGCFSSDGKTLFTTEGNSQTGEGKIGIRDAMTYQQLGEFDTHGIGPHDVRMMPDGKTLVIANGGILTRPETGRKKLNLPEMRSNLTYLDVMTGQKIDEFRVPEAKASIRHLDVAPDGTVAIAMQVQREAMNSEGLVPLGAIQKPGKSIQLLSEPERLIAGMNDYMGSVAINAESRLAGFTSPRGNLVGFWDVDSYDFKGYHQLHDVCGIAVSQDKKRFMISNSLGEVRELDGQNLNENRANRAVYPGSPWDNHMLTIDVS